MIQLPNTISPERNILDKLKEYQDEIDALGTFDERTAKAKSMFSSRNKIGNTAFDAVKVKLTEMCSGARRCMYCEDSVGDEVEHFYPKTLYPNKCFIWENYLYACGNCNGPKNNKFAIFRLDNGQFHEVNQLPGSPALEPPAGNDVMINPRNENPLDFCMLDLSVTFKFVVIADPKTIDHKKAEYTFNEVLRLNSREFLRQARENAYGNYKARLSEYTTRKRGGETQSKLDKIIDGIKREGHSTVWKEMQRQHKMGILEKIDQYLDSLFTNSPESLNW